MFGDPGRKIKVVAFVLFAVSVVVSVVLAVIIAARSSFLLCLLMLIGGPLAGYAGALVLAGFGELVENSGKTNRSPGTERSAYPDGERTGGDAGSEAGRSCYCEEIKPDLPDKLDL